MSEVSTQSEGPEAAPSTGEKIPIEPLKDHFGNEAEIDFDKYPEGSPARDRKTTRPSGQGGASPKARPDYQDQFPKNPPPSESAAEKGRENDRVGTGDTNSVKLANERLANLTGQRAEDADPRQTQEDVEAQQAAAQESEPGYEAPNV